MEFKKLDKEEQAQLFLSALEMVGIKISHRELNLMGDTLKVLKKKGYKFSIKDSCKILDKQ